jgi:hypothetical protein
MNTIEVAPRQTPAERPDTPIEVDVEEDDGIAKLARLAQNGLDVELFHILTFT